MQLYPCPRNLGYRHAEELRDASFIGLAYDHSCSYGPELQCSIFADRSSNESMAELHLSFHICVCHKEKEWQPRELGKVANPCLHSPFGWILHGCGLRRFNE